VHALQDVLAAARCLQEGSHGVGSSKNVSAGGCCGWFQLDAIADWQLSAALCHISELRINTLQAEAVW
jgi:hypothetical protein